MLRSAILALSICLVPVPLAAQPSLIRDINPVVEAGSSNQGPVLSSFTSLGPHAVFLHRRATPESAVSEIWTSDGTDSGTERLHAFPESARVVFFASAGRRAFFSVSDSLWRTDGTEEGTIPLAGGLTVSPEKPVALPNGSLLFGGCVAPVDCEPWVSDGTANGTRRLRDVTPGEYGSNPRSFVVAAGAGWFLATAPDGPGLWRTDGTARGTRRAALLPPSSAPRGLTAAGSRLFFAMGSLDLPTPPATLWTSDGTPQGTRAVPAFDDPRKEPAFFQKLGAIGNALLFLGTDPALGPQVYRTDGTARGSRRLTAFPKVPLFAAGSAIVGNRVVFEGPDAKLWATDGTPQGTLTLGPAVRATEFGLPVFLPLPGKTVFAGSALGPERDLEPWVTDGTPGGTFKLADLCAGECGTFLAFGATLLGEVQFYSSGNLWGTDGTPEGTRLLARGAVSPQQETPRAPIASARRRLVFAGFDETAPPSSFQVVLKSTDGSPEGTRTLDLRLADGGGSNPRGFTPVGPAGDGVFFTACSTDGNFWATEGTPETTVRLTEAGAACDDPRLRPVALGGIVYFLALRPTEYWYELWRSDGTPQGTYELTAFGPEREITPPLVAAGGRLFFFTDVINAVPGDPSELWTSDGTPGGTREAFELDGRYLDSLAGVGDEIFYVAGPDPNERTLYVSDGTREGTAALVRSSPVGDFTRAGGKVFYVATDTVDGSVYKTDGTPGGTLQLLVPGKQVVNLGDLGELGGRLFFLGLDIFDPRRVEGTPTLFRSDGTAAGTVVLKTFAKDDTGLFPQFPKSLFTAAAGALFFVATDPVHGSELWKTDGTAAGTVLVKDVLPGKDSSRISALTGAGDRVFFAADDGEHGVELWTSDGTPAGTRLVADLAEGTLSSFPREIARIGGRVYFSADDGLVGREPWVLPLDSILSGRIIP